MVGYIDKDTGGNFTPTPAGQHIMVCSRIVDLGTQPGSQMFPAPKHKLRIFWELPEERIRIADENGGERDMPVLHSEQYTVSFHEKANLRKMLESWRGAAFTDRDFSGPPDGFHLSKLLGIPAFGQIVHEHKDGKTYANLNSIMKPPKAQFDQWKGKIEGERIFFDLDDFDQAEFDKLSERLQETIKNSPEYQAIMAQQNASADSTPPPQGNGYDPDLRDEIPF
ncbi:phage replication initiation protein, NGO0469 family [Actibacterium sp. MT2.3-13A]|uniref:phage replication initiation protein, NGO0469 family n=1 Tax=Actibacterium sp. MT2.3-13A TaxID=2828332 RepID=UPI001BA8DE92|nr:hypothetical protein [Actibacterium sp. MT2.3-13A]